MGIAGLRIERDPLRPEDLSSWFLARGPVSLACVVSEDRALFCVLEDDQPSEVLGGSQDQTRHSPVITRNQVANGPLACGTLSSACAEV